MYVHKYILIGFLQRRSTDMRLPSSQPLIGARTIRGCERPTYMHSSCSMAQGGRSTRWMALKQDKRVWREGEDGDVSGSKTLDSLARGTAYIHPRFANGSSRYLLYQRAIPDLEDSLFRDILILPCRQRPLTILSRWPAHRSVRRR